MNSPRKTSFILPLLSLACVGSAMAQTVAVSPHTPARAYPLTAVRLLDGPFTSAVAANQAYILALDPDRLLAPFRREAGLSALTTSYGNWENTGLDGHTAGHYLAALANMIASGNDTPTGELNRRLDYMLDQLQSCQQANGDGYLGGMPGSRAFWADIATGDVGAIWSKWVPWYNLHKTYAGLRDAYLVAGKTKARDLMVGFGNWCVNITANLTDDQMQAMLGNEHGGMNEVLADLYAITGDQRYLTLALRFCHHAVLDPLINHVDQLTGLHANTQIPKVIGLERIATLTNNTDDDLGARFFWSNVTGLRAVAFGGNSDNEYFNSPTDFSGMLQSREGPESCNSYNMLRLTEQLFATQPAAAYAEFYECTLFNHLLSAIHPTTPGYAYFTPIRPGHYRVFSQAGQGFWCCVGTGMENPGKYGQFIYAASDDGVYVNLFVASQLTDAARGLVLKQETAFPDQESTKLTLRLAAPATFSLYLRDPWWVASGSFAVTVNGQPVTVNSTPSSYAQITREWHDGDVVQIALPMRTTVKQLPDATPWYAIMRGPILLAYPSSTADLTGLHAGDGRFDHIANGPLISLDSMPALLTTAADLPGHVVADPASGPMRFLLKDIAYPPNGGGLPLEPFFRLQDARYQMYWQFVDQQGLAARQEALAQAEAASLARDAATVDAVSVGAQQSETDHGYIGQNSSTGTFNGLQYRDGASLQYTLNTNGASPVDLVATYWGSDTGRAFDLYANGTRIAQQTLTGEQPNRFMERRYVVPASILAAAPGGALTVKIVATQYLAGGLFGLRLVRPDASAPPVVQLKFDETTGTTTADSSGNGWPGTLVNGPTWVAGAVGNAVNLDGTDDHVTLPNGVVAGLTHCTISAWVKPRSSPTWARIFDFGTGTTNYMFLTCRAAANTVRFAIRTPTVGEQVINGTATLQANAWNHVAVTLAGSVGTLYVNGKAVGTNNAMTLLPSSLGNTTLNYLGRSQFASDAYLPAAVDDFRVYNPALPAADIAAMAQKPGVPSGVSATAGSAQATIKWDAVVGTSVYTIGRATASGGPYTTVATGMMASRLFTDFGLTNGATYYYVVTAVNGSGAGSPSTQVSATPQAAPAAPGNLTATAGDSQVSLNWSASPGATSYTLQRALAADGNYIAVANGLTATAYVDASLVNGTTYSYTVAASNAGGSSTASSPASARPTAPVTARETDSQLLSLTSAGAGLTLQSVVGHGYQLQYIDDLASGTWQNYGTSQPGTGGTISLSMPVPPATPKRFYRVLIQP